MLVVELFLLRTTDEELAQRLADTALRDPDALGAAVVVMGEDDDRGDDDGIEVLAAPTLLLAEGQEGSMSTSRKGTVAIADGYEQISVLDLRLGVSSTDHRVLLDLSLTDTPVEEERGEPVAGEPRTTDYEATVDPSGGTWVLRPGDDLVLVTTVERFTRAGPARGWLLERDARRAALVAEQGKRNATGRRLRVERHLLGNSRP